MTKYYVLDTSSLVSNPHCFNLFPNAHIILPMATIHELDKIKTQSHSQAGKNARLAIRQLDQLLSSSQNNTAILPNNCSLLVETSSPTLIPGDAFYGDTHILNIAALYHQQHPNTTTLVSDDLNLRIKARVHGIASIETPRKLNNFDDLYSGWQIIANEKLANDLLNSGKLHTKHLNIKLAPQEGVIFTDSQGKMLALGRKAAHKESKEKEIQRIKSHTCWGISGKNPEQMLALDLLMDINLDLLTMVGRAGTGKSLLALAAGIELVLVKKKYRKLIIYKPTSVVDEGIGYLPGSLEEKMVPYMQSIFDAFESLFGDKWRSTLDMHTRKGLIEIDCLSYIRGRSIENALIYVDECQNITLSQMKTILTRVGKGTKIVLSGDIDQIDVDGLNAFDNGLVKTVDAFKSYDFAGHIKLIHGERSRLATVASEIL